MFGNFLKFQQRIFHSFNGIFQGSLITNHKRCWSQRINPFLETPSKFSGIGMVFVAMTLWSRRCDVVFGGCLIFVGKKWCSTELVTSSLERSSKSSIAQGSEGDSSSLWSKCLVSRVIKTLFLNWYGNLWKSHSSRNLNTAKNCLHGKWVLFQLSHLQVGSEKLTNSLLLSELLLTRNSPFSKLTQFTSYSEKLLLGQCFTKCRRRLCR